MKIEIVIIQDNVYYVGQWWFQQTQRDKAFGFIVGAFLPPSFHYSTFQPDHEYIRIYKWTRMHPMFYK